MKKLRQDIRANQFERVYLLYGEERYLVQMYKNQLKKAIIGDDTMNLNQYTGKGLPVQEVENAVMTMPFFFADRRLVLLEDTGLFKSSDEQWSNLVKTIPDSCHVLFVEQEVDKRSRMYKAVKECGYCAEMTHPSMQQRTQWILKGFGRYGLKITQSALDSFLEKQVMTWKTSEMRWKNWLLFVWEKKVSQKKMLILSVRDRLKIESLI